MKKVLSSILISFIVFTNLFAPFSVGFDKKGVEISKNEANAVESTKIQMGVTSKTTMAGTSLEVEARFNYPVELEKSSFFIYYFVTTDTTKQITDNNNAVQKENGSDLQDPVLITGGMYQYKFGHSIYTYLDANGATRKIEDGVTYYIYTAVFQKVDNVTTQIGGSDIQSWKGGTLSPTGGAPTPEGQAEAKAAYDASIASGNTPEQALVAAQGLGSETVVESQSIDSGIPACSFNPLSIKGSVMGCVAQGFYYALFVPTSYLFALSGIFFDNTFAYSVQDTSYRSSFVVEGWGLVRDFCNLFFIFVLLYVAIGTILDLPHFKTKETIIHVVVIGLLINFSLFATQVIIDASNITARVFYNADTIKIVQGSNTGASDWVAEAKTNGVLPMSAALVNKINPQNIILQAKQINQLQAKSSSGSIDTKSQKTEGIGIGSFITIVLLATFVNVIGFIVFLSVGLIFVSRVVGLWVAMILAPLAFFTYIIPSFAKTKMIGWENWWPDTLKLAFLAPVFMFFMYIILKFLELDIISDPTSKTGLDFFISILIPFAFIVILMWKAKGIASDMSGEMGKQITGGVATIGGAALGGAALGTAFLGRKTIGGLLKGSATGDTAAQRYARGESKGAWDSFKGRIGSNLGGVQIQRSIGDFLNQRTNRLQENAHGRNRLDEVSGQVYHGRKWDSLNATERDAVRDRINQTEAMRQMGTWGNRTWAQLNDPERATVNAHITTNNVNEAQHIVQHAQRTTRVQDRLLQSASFGTYDIRNISKIVANEYDSKFNKIGIGIMSTVAQGLRGGLKKSGINYGEGQGEFFKDLSHTLTEALKSSEIKVDLSHVGKETKGEADHGAGHGGGHH